jgi:hypothetical protein
MSSPSVDPDVVPKQQAVAPVAAAEPVKLASADASALPILLASSAVASPVQESAARVWTLAREDRTVRSALERWARHVEWQVSWEFPTDFQIEFNADFDGDFIDAVARVVEGLSVPERPVRAEFYKGNRCWVGAPPISSSISQPWCVTRKRRSGKPSSKTRFWWTGPKSRSHPLWW